LAIEVNLSVANNLG